MTRPDAHRTGSSGGVLPHRSPRGEPLLALSRLGRTFAGPPPTVALHDVSLTVASGEYVAVTGPSGSGKSTLLNVLGLLDRPTTGEYAFEGVPTASLSDRDRTSLRGRRIGFVFQDFQLLPYRTALENVMLRQLYLRVPRARRAADAEAALRLVGLGDRLHSLPTTMSGGERQRVAVARALAASPALLLADEPTGSLDSTNTSDVLALFDDVHRTGVTLVAITHDPVVAHRAQRVVSLRDGQVDRCPA